MKYFSSIKMLVVCANVIVNEIWKWNVFKENSRSEGDKSYE